MAVGVVGIDKGSLMAALLTIGFDIAEGKVEELETVATGGNVLFQIVGRQIGDGERYHDFFGCRGCLFVEGRNYGGENLLVGFVKLFANFVGKAIDHGTLFDAHHIDVGITLVGNDRDDIDVVDASIDNGGSALVVFKKRDFAFERFGFFETEIGRTREHFLFHPFDNQSEIAFQKPLDRGDGLHVMLVGFKSCTRSKTKTNLVLDAGPGSGGCGGGQVLGTGAIRKKIADDFLQFSKNALIRIGTEIAAFEMAIAGEKQLGEVFVGKTEIGIAFVVFEEAVVTRLILFDERVFE